jgi:predicted ester cyclase
MGREANKEIVRRYRAALNTNVLQLLDVIVAAEVITHGFMEGLSPGLTGGKLLHQVIVAAFPDQQVTTDDLIAEGDRVVERWTQTGTHMGAPFMGASANGKTFAVTGISIYRIAGSQIVEHWSETNMLDLLQQLDLTCMPEEATV